MPSHVSRRKAVKEALRPFFSRLKKVSRILRGKHKPNYVMRKRREIGEQLAVALGRTVRYGPFKGMRLGAEKAWGDDSAGMLLGFYEQEILESLQRVPATHRTFVDIGGANGYYAVGMLVGGLAERAYTFERSAAGQEVIRANASLNGVANRLKVHGSADAGFYRAIDAPLGQCVLMVDIEGGEFELLDEAAFAAFRGAVIFIELHEFLVADGAAKLAALRARAEKHFRITELTTGARDPSRYPELDALGDDERWVICSEGRGRRMKWWRLDPR